ALPAGERAAILGGRYAALHRLHQGGSRRSEEPLMRAEAASSPIKTEVWPLLRQPRGDAPVAFGRRRAIAAAEFLRDVAALAAALPRRAHMLNLCTDRYRFTVGFAAALCREQVSLLPPDDRPATIRAIAADFAEVYCLIDGAAPAGVSSFAFPPLAGPP